MSSNCCSGQNRGQVSLRRPKNYFSQRCKTCRAVGLCPDCSGDRAEARTDRRGKGQWGASFPLTHAPAQTMRQSGTSPVGSHPPLAVDVYLQKATDWYFHCLAVQQLPSVIVVHASDLAVGKTHSDPHRSEFPGSPAAAAQLCITSSAGWC